MKIKIAPIPSERVAKARELSEKLAKAVEAGEMQTVDQIADHLLSLADKIHCASISEESWHRMISSIRKIDDRFRSDYLIEIKQLEMIVSAGLPDLHGDVETAMRKALEYRGVVLQLPYEMEDDSIV